jgi:hypothetical protein
MEKGPHTAASPLDIWLKTQSVDYMVPEYLDLFWSGTAGRKAGSNPKAVPA